MEYSQHTHTIDPVYNQDSKILILGSFPSVKSREMAFYYGHPQNRFWPLMAKLFNDDFPESVRERREFLLRHQIALWDVIASCEIKGSSDSSIINAEPNDLSPIVQSADIKTIYTNGTAATRLFHQYQEKTLGRKSIYLPSTSSANARWSFTRLYEDWQIILSDFSK